MTKVRGQWSAICGQWLPMTKWERYRSLSRTERRLLHQALVLLPLTALGLRLFGFRRLQSLLSRLPRPSVSTFAAQSSGQGSGDGGQLIPTADIRSTVHGSLSAISAQPCISYRCTDAPSTVALSYARRQARMVTIAARHGPYRANCLRQSVVLWWLLRRHGIECDLRIGVRNSSEFEAHAWVELNGNVLNDAQDIHKRFAPFQLSISTDQPARS